QLIGKFVGNHQFIDQYFDIVVLVSVYPHTGKNLLNLTIDPHMEVTLLANLLEKFLVMPFTIANYRRQAINFRLAILLQKELDNLLLAMRRHLRSRKVRIGSSRRRKEQPEKIVYLRGSTYGRTRILAARSLRHGNHGAHSAPLIHAGTLNLSQKTTRISRKG